MIWSADFRDEVENLIKHHEGDGFKIKYFEPVSGGDINSAYKIHGNNDASFFIKINDADCFSDLFEKEVLSLITINETSAVRTPKVITYGKSGVFVYLVLEWIDTISFTAASMYDLGKRLAKMHLYRNENYGFSVSNYIGSLIQVNDYTSDWIEFFCINRIFPQLKMAESKGLLGIDDLLQFDKLINLLPELYEKEKPALLHGDLWSGNAIVNQLQEPILIDPAVYYGNREVDIAMTRLFGGFSNEFYAAYQETYPLKKGWEQRCEIWNLYPLLVHLNLFGAGYLYQIRNVLNRFLK